MFNLEIKKKSEGRKELTEAQKLAFVIAWVEATGKDFNTHDEKFMDWLMRVHKFSEDEAEDIADSWWFFSNSKRNNSARKYLARLEEKEKKEKKFEELIEKNLEKLAERTEKAIKESSKK